MEIYLARKTLAHMAYLHGIQSLPARHVIHPPPFWGTFLGSGSTQQLSEGYTCFLFLEALCIAYTLTLLTTQDAPHPRSFSCLSPSRLDTSNVLCR